MYDSLMHLAEQLLVLDPQELRKLQPQIQARMEQADGTPEWEKAVVAFFMISSLGVKDHLAQAAGRAPVDRGQEPPRLRRVK